MSCVCDSYNLSLIIEIIFTNFISNIIQASIAQGLEHWSCKPGVVSSILTGGYKILFYKLQFIFTESKFNAVSSQYEYRGSSRSWARDLSYPKRESYR